ncbi:MAG TPA: carboxylesterase family protein [Vicinamibacterales bacterium]|nr:carboxylesterase family protein [Vicinamibacterales bacterium]
MRTHGHPSTWMRVLMCVAAIAMASVLSRAAIDSVRTDSGEVVAGPTSSGVTAFLGVPYAAPPVGNLRWRPPQPATYRNADWKADQFSPSCIQSQPRSRLPWTEEFMAQGPISENCLYLNVWTAAKNASARLPVMVWIYGGGFTEGSSAIAVYDGSPLARKGVVVVTINYRVGPLGFLAHPELTQESANRSSGNYGLLDQIAALRWVQRNIAGFGGDPAQVTIFGQSAGAISVADLMRSPLSKGLFARAIALSGPGLFGRNALGGNATLQDREKAGLAYAQAKGAPTLAELRALPSTAFVPGSGAGAPTVPSSPVVDGWVLPADAPADQVPLMVGFVADDLGIGGTTPAEKAAARERARVSMHLWAADQAKASKRVYTYFFDRAIPWPEHPEFGAFHSGELPYVFNTLSRLKRPWQPVDQKLADTVSSYVTNFAKKSDPNATGLPQWPAYDPAVYSTMQLGESVGPMDLASRERLSQLLEDLKR